MNACDQSLDVTAGRIHCLFDRSTLFLRRVRWNNIEVVRAVYAAIRDRNWGTVPTRTESFQCDHGGNSTTIGFEAVCSHGPVFYRYTASIRLTEGELRFEFEGEAQSDFLRNRIGICVLHPIELCAGAECVVEHWDGREEHGLFPQLVRPDQPFKDIRKLRHAVGETGEIEIAFEGEIFEMEDQRNWTDSSFKTYGTPLALPFPQQVRKGDRLKQAVTVKFLENSARSRATDLRRSGSRVDKVHASVLRLDFSRLRAKPRLGFGGSGVVSAPSPLLLKQLQHLRCDHLRVDCRFQDADWRSRLEKEIATALAIDAGLHIAAFLGPNAEQELRGLSEICLRMQAPVKLWLIFARDTHCTPPELVKMAETILAVAHPNIPFGAGTDANFAELNRSRPSVDATWHPSFSINPQVHASDELSMIENLAAQRDVVRSAAAFSNRSIAISSITLRPRFNPGTSASYDSRQDSLFAAQWTLGSITTLAPEPNVHWITYFETIGPGGLMSDAGVLYPVYHVFAGIAELSMLADASVVPESNIAVIAGTSEHGERIVFATNHGCEAQAVQLECESKPVHLRLQVLESNENAAQDPFYWKNAPAQNLHTRELQLPAGAIVRLEMI